MHFSCCCWMLADAVPMLDASLFLLLLMTCTEYSGVCLCCMQNPRLWSATRPLAIHLVQLECPVVDQLGRQSAYWHHTQQLDGTVTNNHHVSSSLHASYDHMLTAVYAPFALALVLVCVCKCGVASCTAECLLTLTNKTKLIKINDFSAAAVCCPAACCMSHSRLSGNQLSGTFPSATWGTGMQSLKYL